MVKPAKKCCITGTGGYLGGCLVRYFTLAGWEVIELNRTGTIRAGGAEARCFTLGEEFSVDLMDADVLIHAAYDFQALTWSEIKRINIKGTARLLKSARQAGVKKIIHISSMSAFDSCRSLYGRAKLQIEADVFKVGGISLRPGLIYGDNNPGGMVGKLQSLVSKFPIIPLPGNGRNNLYFSHHEDLSKLIEEHCSDLNFLGGNHIITANSTPWEFREILKELAHRHNHHIVCIPTPWQLSWIALKIPEIFGMTLPLKSDSLISFLNQEKSPNFDPAIKLKFRSF
jgi:nucleoside-diphosphate-sugar epimerase